jgi:hypothetical protein
MTTTAPSPASALELPELAVLPLDLAGVERLFVELAFETTVLGVLVQGGTTDRAKAPAPSLGTAREILLQEEARGLQIRYLYQGVEWWGTLMRTQAGVRFVRVRRDSGPAQ